MLLEREGYPAEDELVLVSITKVNPSSVFVVLDHYGRRTGLIHISEVSPGRIRNIRDYVQEGKKAVCKILRVDEEKGHIDVSLRRVTEIQKRAFTDNIKQEQKGEKLLKQFSTHEKLTDAQVMKSIVKPVHEQYDFVHEFFKDVVEQEIKVSDVIEDAAIAKPLEIFIIERIQPPEVMLQAEVKLQLFNPDGATLLRNALSDLQAEKVEIKYKGAGAYKLIVRAKDYKLAEKMMQEKVDVIESFAEKEKGTFAVER